MFVCLGRSPIRPFSTSLRQQYPQAKLAHAFASTEAGVAFEVNDGLMGFPADVLAQNPSVEMKVEGGTLRIRSDRTAVCYLGRETQPLKDGEGFVDTGDLLELRAGRYYFAGREDGTINVGGLKVHPEEVEAVINRHPQVSMSLVRMKKSPITGAIVIADVVLKTPQSVPEGATTDAARHSAVLPRRACTPQGSSRDQFCAGTGRGRNRKADSPPCVM